MTFAAALLGAFRLTATLTFFAGLPLAATFLLPLRAVGAFRVRPFRAAAFYFRLVRSAPRLATRLVRVTRRRLFTDLAFFRCDPFGRSCSSAASVSAASSDRMTRRACGPRGKRRRAARSSASWRSKASIGSSDVRHSRIRPVRGTEPCEFGAESNRGEFSDGLCSDGPGVPIPPEAKTRALSSCQLGT